MLRLDTTTRKLEVILGGAITTNQLPITASWSDASSGGYLGGATVINTNSTVAVVAVAAPTAAGTIRDVDYMSVKNSDTVAAAVTVRYNDNGTLYSEVTITLQVNDVLIYTHAKGWYVLSSAGQIKAGGGISSIGASTDNALVRWDGTGGTAIQNSGIVVDDSNNVTGVVALSISSFGANWTNAGRTVADLGIVTTVDINGGTLDGVTIGGASAGSGSFTTGTFSSTVTLSGTAANIATGANYISYGGTDAGFSLDASNNATFSGSITGAAGSFTTLDATNRLIVTMSQADDRIMARFRNDNASGFGSGIEFFSGFSTPSVNAQIFGLPQGAGMGGQLTFWTQRNSDGALIQNMTLDRTGSLTLSGTLTVASLAGTGTRTVVVDANGVMSAP